MINKPEIYLLNGTIITHGLSTYAIANDPESPDPERRGAHFENPESGLPMTIIERVWKLEKALGIETGRYRTVKAMAGNISPNTYKNKLKRHIRYKKKLKNND